MLIPLDGASSERPIEAAGPGPDWTRPARAEITRRRSKIMKTARVSYFTMMTAGLVAILAAFSNGASARSASKGAARAAGAVKGPEAGVWVIAETTDLPTKFVKIVVTDDQGRYLIPDLPKAGYKVWARGYGLVDSKPVEGWPGKSLNLNAVIAPDAHAAAQYYPANYWFSLAQVPDKSEFPGTGPKGNGISPDMKT